MKRGADQGSPLRRARPAFFAAALVVLILAARCGNATERRTVVRDSVNSGPVNASAGQGDATGEAGAGGAQAGSGGGGGGGPVGCVPPDRRCARELSYPWNGETSVEIRGNFIPGGWVSGVPMKLDASGWKGIVQTPWLTETQYKFVIDGKTWVFDSKNPAKVDDGYGGFNSVLKATGCDPYACFPKPSVRFAVIGDYGTAAYGEAFAKTEGAVAALIKSWAPDFVLTLGDNNYPDGLGATIDLNIGQFFHDFISPYVGAYGEGASENRFFPCLGNHDYNSGSINAYLDYFSLPGNERYWELVRGPVHIFCVNSEPQEPDGITADSVQGKWLQGALAASTSPFRVVITHKAPFSSGSHGSTPHMQWPFAAWGASVVMAGHDHSYERLTVDGVPYFVNGIGSASPYGFSKSLPGSEVRFTNGYGAMLVEVSPDADRMTFQTITIDAKLADYHAIAAP